MDVWKKEYAKEGHCVKYRHRNDEIEDASVVLFFEYQVGLSRHALHEDA